MDNGETAEILREARETQPGASHELENFSPERDFADLGNKAERAIFSTNQESSEKSLESAGLGEIIEEAPRPETPAASLSIANPEKLTSADLSALKSAEREIVASPGDYYAKIRATALAAQAAEEGGKA